MYAFIWYKKDSSIIELYDLIPLRENHISYSIIIGYSLNFIQFTFKCTDFSISIGESCSGIMVKLGLNGFHSRNIAGKFVEKRSRAPTHDAVREKTPKIMKSKLHCAKVDKRSPKMSLRGSSAFYRCVPTHLPLIYLLRF